MLKYIGKLLWFLLLIYKVVDHFNFLGVNMTPIQNF
jgi:hypothetical protein